MSYLLSDHIGSTSVIANAGGAWAGEQRYKAWGEVRYAAEVMPTKYTYTGQYSYSSDFGLMFYNARWYDPALGRFAQGDSLVPQSNDPTNFDRYAYVNNNPLRYRDPSGHWLDTVIDIASLVYDVYDIHNNGLTWENGLSLTADLVSLALPVATGGGAIVRVAAHTDDVVDAARLIDNLDEAVLETKEMVNALEESLNFRGKGIHPASTGKSFSDWFKKYVLKNPAAKGMKDTFNESSFVFDIVTKEDGVDVIYELKNYSPTTKLTTAFKNQAMNYLKYANRKGYQLRYVFRQMPDESILKFLQEKGIAVFIIDSSGNMIPLH